MFQSQKKDHHNYRTKVTSVQGKVDLTLFEAHFKTNEVQLIKGPMNAEKSNRFTENDPTKLDTLESLKRKPSSLTPENRYKKSNNFKREYPLLENSKSPTKEVELGSGKPKKFVLKIHRNLVSLQVSTKSKARDDSPLRSSSNPTVAPLVLNETSASRQKEVQKFSFLSSRVPKNRSKNYIREETDILPTRDLNREKGQRTEYSSGRQPSRSNISKINEKFDLKAALKDRKLPTLEQLNSTQNIEQNIVLDSKKERTATVTGLTHHKKFPIESLPMSLIIKDTKIDRNTSPERNYGAYQSKYSRNNLPEQRNPLDQSRSSLFVKQTEVSQSSTSRLNENTEKFVHPRRIRLASIALEKCQLSTLTSNGVGSFSFKSRGGEFADKTAKTNQDSSIVCPDFAGCKDKYFFAICDGHGTNGHLVSNFVKHQLPRALESQYKLLSKDDPASIKGAITESFLKTNRDLSNAPFDIGFSGTTTVSVLIFNTRLWCANVGDSRAIIGKCVNGQWEAFPLSIDHKPDSLHEKERILKSGGRVEPKKDLYGDFIGPIRVWYKDSNKPGLAMSRSLGDSKSSPIGVIPDPDIVQYDLKEEDKFIVLASDGIWDVLSNQEVVDIIAPFYHKNYLDSACDKLIREATNHWKEEQDIIDDITCILISLKAPKVTKRY